MKFKAIIIKLTVLCIVSFADTVQRITLQCGTNEVISSQTVTTNECQNDIISEQTQNPYEYECNNNGQLVLKFYNGQTDCSDDASVEYVLDNPNCVEGLITTSTCGTTDTAGTAGSASWPYYHYYFIDPLSHSVEPTAKPTEYPTVPPTKAPNYLIDPLTHSVEPTAKPTLAPITRSNPRSSAGAVGAANNDNWSRFTAKATNLNSFYITKENDGFGLELAQYDGQGRYVDFLIPSTYKIVPAVNNLPGYISIQSIWNENYYIGHELFVGKLLESARKNDISWKQVPAVNGNTNYVSYETSTDGLHNYYLVHENYKLYIQPYTSTEEWKNRASWNAYEFDPVAN